MTTVQCIILAVLAYVSESVGSYDNTTDGSTTGSQYTTSSNICNVTSSEMLSTPTAKKQNDNSAVSLLSYQVYGYLLTATSSAIGIISIVTNGLSLIVFVRMTRKKQHVFIVFIAISIVDTFCLIDQFHAAVNKYTSNRSLLKYDAMCRLFKWIQATSQDCSSYLSLLYTVERFISVRYPLKCAIICTKKRIIRSVITIFIVSMMAEIYTLVFLKGDNITTCGVWPENYGNYKKCNVAIHLLAGRFVPYMSIAVLNVMIVIQMIHHRQQRAKMSVTAPKDDDAKAQRSMTAMLVVVSTYSLLLTTPSFVAWCLIPWGDTDNERIAFYISWANKIFLPWNYCANFFFYVAAGKQFRKELRSMFSVIRWRAQPAGETNIAMTPVTSATAGSTTTVSTIAT